MSSPFRVVRGLPLFDPRSARELVNGALSWVCPTRSLCRWGSGRGYPSGPLARLGRRFRQRSCAPDDPFIFLFWLIEDALDECPSNIVYPIGSRQSPELHRRAFKSQIPHLHECQCKVRSVSAVADNKSPDTDAREAQSNARCGRRSSD